jgi:hypothetical protein
LVGIIDLMHIELFLSAVTNEFRDYRDSLRALLKRPKAFPNGQERLLTEARSCLRFVAK